MPGIDRIDHTAITAVARNHQSQPIMVDCIAHYYHLDNQWHCLVTDMFVWIAVLLVVTANTATSVESHLLNFRRPSYIVLVLLYGCTAQQTSNNMRRHALQQYDNRSSILSSRLLSSTDRPAFR